MSEYERLCQDFQAATISDRLLRQVDPDRDLDQMTRIDLALEAFAKVDQRRKSAIQRSRARRGQVV